HRAQSSRRGKWALGNTRSGACSILTSSRSLPGKTCTNKQEQKNMNKETDMDKNKKRDMERGHLAMAVAVGVLLALTGVSAASASDPGDARGTEQAWARGCAEQFELAQRTDMESLRDYDIYTLTEAL